MKKAIVIKKISNFFYCFSEGKLYESKALGILNKGRDSIVVGDKVEIELNNDSEDTATIVKVSERKNMLNRPYIANVDLAIVVFSVKEPEINSYVIDTFLATIEKENIDILLCFSKVDLDKDRTYKDILNLYDSIGYKTIEVSAIEKTNVDELKKILHGKTSFLAGPSGVGKSSIINSFSDEFNLKTSKISKKLQRGKNTTTYAQLLKIDEDTYVADTPGFTSVKLSEVNHYSVKDYFIEFGRYSNNCKFKNSCMHYKEPNCAIKQMVEEGQINKTRYENYIRIFEETRDKPKYY